MEKNEKINYGLEQDLIIQEPLPKVLKLA